MTLDKKLLLQNLLARLEADAETGQPQFRGIVSDLERDALRSLLEALGTTPTPPDLSTEPVDRSSAERGIAADRSAVKLNTRALNIDSSPAPRWTLSLDFGTAKSKAFAATDDEVPELLPLAIGKADEDFDGSVYEVSSSVWIDNDGLLFVGSEAFKRGLDYGDPTRQRLDSLKQEISQIHGSEGPARLERKLPKEIDPTSTLTYSDAITSYLAYLTDLATTELERDRQVETRYVRRRFTVPWWTKEQRRWAASLLTKSLKRAQLLADTFHGRWRDGIHVNQIKHALQDVAAYDEELAWMVLGEPADGVLEALAAASARVWNDRSARNIMLVVDVGAGTTDLSLFWVVQRAHRSGRLEEFRRAWPIDPCGTAIKQAGDTLDSLLLSELMQKADLGEDKALKRRVRDGLNVRGVRRLKETLFDVGEITEFLVNDQTVTLSREEFMNSRGVKQFRDQICKRIQNLLDGMDHTWEQAAAGQVITLVLTGGGCHLPMIRSLRDERWQIGTRQVECRLAADLPQDVADRFRKEFIQEYPKLTVAMGGALKMLLDERDAMSEWSGGAPTPHRLERFPITGV